MTNMGLRLILQYTSNGQNVYDIVKNLTIFVKKFVYENFLFQKSLKDLSVILDIPKTVLEKDLTKSYLASINLIKKNLFLRTIFYLYFAT